MIITISREYEAGGRSIAKGLAEKLGLPWYDRDFVKLTAKASGFSEEDIDEDGEELSDSTAFMDSILNNITAYTSSHDAIFQAQKEEILALSKEPCILVGRCANIILREAGVPSFDIFLHADRKVRIERTMRSLDKDESAAAKYLDRKDELRENYYKKYTKRPLKSAQDYHICLDTGVLSYEKCVELLVQMYQDCQ